MNFSFKVDARGFAVENWQKMMLDPWWPYSMLLILLYNVETSAERKIVETGMISFHNLIIYLINQYYF